MENRIKVYEEAKSKHPGRWSKGIINWELPKYVSLNPIAEKEIKDLLNKSN